MGQFSDHEIIYRFTDLITFRTIAELPLSDSTTFSLALNGAGPFQGTLPIEDPKVRQSDWLTATLPNKSAVFVEIDGQIVNGAGYMITGRKTKKQGGICTLTGADFYGYLSQRLQAQDYTAYTDPLDYAWAVLPGAPAAVITYFVALQAMAEEYSIPIDIVPVPTPDLPTTDYWITFTAPISQQSTIDSVVSNMTSMGYEVGVDIAQDIAIVDGLPVPQLTISYPRRGRVAGTTGLQVSLGDAIDYEWDEDGTAQANSVVEQTGASGAVSSAVPYTPSMSTYGYPLLEASISHASMSPTAAPDSVLAAFAAADLGLLAFPQLAPVVTVPVFGEGLSLTDFLMGDDMLLYSPTGNQGIPVEPRFPNGLQEYLRLVRADVTIPDKGVAKMDLTFNLPPSDTPTPPPV